jgi:cytochrome c peroxidase
MRKALGRIIPLAAMATVVVALLLAASGAAETGLTPMQELGSFLYFDENLSQPDGMSCATCHDPAFGFVDPDFNLPVSEGVLPGRVGNRNAPMSAYAMYAPIFHYDEGEGLFIGGQFWDGRATGLSALGDPLADQAVGPPLNPLEMANPNKDTYVRDVEHSDYAALFEEVWGAGILDDVEAAYDKAGLSVAAFERTALFAQFSSRYDAYLQACMKSGGKVKLDDLNDCAQGIGNRAAKAAASTLTAAEWQGLQLFMNPTNDNNGVLEAGEGAACVLCHVADWTMAADYALDVVVPGWAPQGMVPPVFTDFTFDNLGVPKNWDNPFLYLPPSLNPDGEDFIDLGLGGFLAANPDLVPANYDYTVDNGKHKVMTLRNIDLTPPYAHNGFFEGLIDITHFYNTRDKDGVSWDEAEVPGTVNHDELGDLGLSTDQELLLVEFMKTLSDGYQAP